MMKTDEEAVQIEQAIQARTGHTPDSLNLLSESETDSLKQFLKEKVALSNKRNGVKPLSGSDKE